MSKRLEYLKEHCICVLHSEVRDGMLYRWYEIKKDCPVLYIHGTWSNPKPVRV